MQIMTNLVEAYIIYEYVHKHKSSHDEHEKCAKGRLTAGFARRLVSGKRRVPAPPPSIIATTVRASRFSISRSLNCNGPPQCEPLIKRVMQYDNVLHFNGLD